MTGKLYVVATPIGNLSDMTLRAIEVLNEVDLIAAEDTRHSQKLLNHYQITTKLLSLHQHNEHKQAVQLIELLKEGKQIALIHFGNTSSFPLLDGFYVQVANRLHETLPPWA